MDCVLTDTLQPKKLLYLNLKNQAESQPDRAILAVNSFVKACGSQSSDSGLGSQKHGVHLGGQDYRICL